MSESSWTVEVTQVDDPLAGYRKQPIISRGGPNASYVGCVIIEFWEDATAHDDGDRLAISADAVDGNHAQLLDRIAAALPLRLRKGNPFA
jgi:hypothetical protein